MWRTFIVPQLMKIELATINLLVNLTVALGKKTADPRHEWVSWQWLGFMYTDHLCFDHLSFLGIDLYDN